MTTTMLRLHTDCLFSRHGFNDGDCPDVVLDWCDAEGLEYPEPRCWDAVLVELVRTRLVSWLSDRFEVYEISTTHNPIRASKVDDVDVDLKADNDALVATLPIASVDLNSVAVLAAIRRHTCGEAPC